MKFATKGIDGLNPKMGGRYCENMTFEEEAKFLEQFRERAEAGQIVEVSEIKKAYDEIIGHVSGSGQIYYVLHRHGCMIQSAHLPSIPSKVSLIGFGSIQ